MLADGFIVERKAANDFVLSIQDRRIFSQAAVMKSAYKRCVVVVEGDVFATRSAMTPEAILGAISWLTVLEGIPVLTTRDTQQTAELLLTKTPGACPHHSRLEAVASQRRSRPV